MRNTLLGRICFYLFNTPIDLEILVEIKFMCDFQERFSFIISPRKLKFDTLSIAIELIRRFITPGIFLSL